MTDAPSSPASPLVVYGDVSLDYDFGPEHPLTPRRFGPSIDLMRTVGAANFLEPRVATDDELDATAHARVHRGGARHRRGPVRAIPGWHRTR